MIFVVIIKCFMQQLVNLTKVCFFKRYYFHIRFNGIKYFYLARSYFTHFSASLFDNNFYVFRQERMIAHKFRAQGMLRPEGLQIPAFGSGNKLDEIREYYTTVGFFN